MKVTFTISDSHLGFLSEIKISHIILFSAILRMFLMPFPNGGGKVFDEVHYINAVEAILNGIHANPEHPPLTKLIVAGFVKTFGNFWFSWRMPMVICSLASTYLVYLIAKEIFDEKIALLASTFLIFDIIFFIHGNIFMLEPPAIMFGLLFIWMFLKKRYAWAGASIGLSGLASEKALFFVFGTVLYGLFTHGIKNIDKGTLKKIGIFILMTGLVGVGGLATFNNILPPSKASSVNIAIQNTVIVDPEGNPMATEIVTSTQTSQVYINNPVEHVLWMWSYYTGINSDLTTNEVNFRPPWNWITPFTSRPKGISENNGNGIAIFNSANYYSKTVSFGDKTDFLINYQAQTPILIWYMTIPILILSIYKWKENESKFIISWVIGSYMPWFISDLSKQNMTFNHYFLPTIPIIAIGIPWFWRNTVPKYWKYITAIHLISTIAFFFWFFPVGLRRTI